MKTATSLTLLDGLRDVGNHVAWERFLERHQPMVLAFATRAGLDGTDAEDAAQDTLLAFVAGYRDGAAALAKVELIRPQITQISQMDRKVSQNLRNLRILFRGEEDLRGQPEMGMSRESGRQPRAADHKQQEKAHESQ